MNSKYKPFSLFLSKITSLFLFIKKALLLLKKENIYFY